MMSLRDAWGIVALRRRYRQALRRDAGFLTSERRMARRRAAAHYAATRRSTQSRPSPSGRTRS